MITELPKVTFKTRVPDESSVCPITGDASYIWKYVTTQELFDCKKSIVFSLPGAFTPTCSTYQLPDFEKLYPQFKAIGIDEIYCMSVNDSFVMNAWAKDQGLENVKVIPDGSGEFTRQMGMLVDKDNLGFGQRSWRYAVYIDGQKIVHSWVEPGREDNAGDDPYGETVPSKVLADLVELGD
jgi:peroxiredoxin